MRGCRRILAQSAAATPCRSSWLSTSSDLMTPTAEVEFEGESPIPETGSSSLFLARWSHGIAPYWWRMSSCVCFTHHYAASTLGSTQLKYYAHVASIRHCHSSGGLVRRLVIAPAHYRNDFCFIGSSSSAILSAACALHTTSPRLIDAVTDDASSAAITDDVQKRSDDLEYNQERHIESAGALLREVYGPQAKLVLHQLTQSRRQGGVTPVAASRHSNEGIQEGETTVAAGSPTVSSTAPTEGLYYHASATFRFLGFAVELAVAKGHRPKETIESCLQQALASDITFIRPSSHNSNNTHNNDNGFHRFGGNGSGGGGRADGGAFVRQDRRHQKKLKGKQNSNSNSHHSAIGFTQRNANSTRAPRLTPHQLELKAIVDDLRQLCIHFSRNVKFSVKPPFAVGRNKSNNTANATSTAGEQGHEASAENEEALREGAMADKQWRCRCYVKEEWGTIAQPRLALEMSGSSPNDALVRCVTQLRQQYREELESPAVLEEGVREVAGMVQLQGKTVTSMCDTEPPSHTLSSAASSPSSSSAGLMEVLTYRAHVDVTDAHGNIASYTARQKASPYMAYESAASLALRAETLWDRETHLLSEGMTTPPLLWRLRWQFDLLLDHICRETGQAPEDVAWIQLRSDTAPHAIPQQQHSDSDMAECRSSSGGGGGGAGADSLGLSPGGVISGVVVPPVPSRFTGSLFSERDVLVWQTSGGGRYRVEFDTYVQALYHLLDQYADCLSTLPCMDRGVGESLLFPTASVLDLHVHRHDAFPVLQHHHGNLNCYALLGTLTSQLLGCPYGTHYHYDTTTNEYTATLTVNDGRMTNQPLIQRRSKRKGEAWRFACLDAMKENFPRQYAAILDRYPEIDLSADDMARSAHLRALPREKRIPYFVNLSVMVMAFAEEDLGWRQPRVRLRNLANSLGLPQWTAELEAQVEGEEGRRVVAVSASFPQMQAARRSLIYRLGKQYFPEELAVYKSLKRSDIVDPESAEVARVNKLYTPNAAVNSSMVSHVLALIEGRHPTSAPVRFTIEARVRGAAAEESVEGDADPYGLLDMRYVEGDTVMLYAQEPATILRPPHIGYTARVLGNRGDVLIADFDSDSATTAADAQAVPVLVTALKSASFHLAQGDAETLWTEYETHPLPAATSARVLATMLFNQFFGVNVADEALTVLPSLVGIPNTAGGSSIAASSNTTGAEAAVEGVDMDDLTLTNFDTSITVVTTKVEDYWFGTAVLPRLGMLPIARAVASSKRKCTSDALIAAARCSFPRVLQYAVKHDVAAAALAAEILTEPIVEQLPPSVCRDILAQLARKKRPKTLPPFQLLVKCTKEAYPQRERFIRVQQTHDTSHGFQYRLYLQRGRVVRPGDTQLVGYGVSASSAPAALHRAAIMALENLYETALYGAITAQPNYREPPTGSS